MSFCALLRYATHRDIPSVEALLLEWLNWKAPRNESLRRAIENNELLVAELKGKVVGFIHFVVHEDIIDGGPNAFITPFCVKPSLWNKGFGSALLQRTWMRHSTEAV